MDSSHIPDGVQVFYWTAINGPFYNVYWALWAAVKGVPLIMSFSKNTDDVDKVNLGISRVTHGTVILSGSHNYFTLGKF